MTEEVWAILSAVSLLIVIELTHWLPLRNFPGDHGILFHFWFTSLTWSFLRVIFCTAHDCQLSTATWRCSMAQRCPLLPCPLPRILFLPWGQNKRPPFPHSPDHLQRPLHINLCLWDSEYSGTLSLGSHPPPTRLPLWVLEGWADSPCWSPSASHSVACLAFGWQLLDLC